MGYHLFSVYCSGDWYKVPHIFEDDDFYSLIARGNGEVPLNMKVFHFNHLDQLLLNHVIESRPVLCIPLWELFTTTPKRAMKLKDKVREQTLPVSRKCKDFALAETELGLRFYYITGEQSSLITEMTPFPITLREARSYVDKHHRHNAAPKFHKFSICLRTEDELEPVGVVIASTPKARHQMDGVTLELNRCCSDPRYADACSRLYALAVRTGRGMGYRRFLTYTLPEESGSSLRAVGFQLDGIVPASATGWNSLSRSRKPERYPKGEKLRWVLQIGVCSERNM